VHNDSRTVDQPENQPSTSSHQPEPMSSSYADALLQISPLPKAIIVPGAKTRKSTGSGHQFSLQKGTDGKATGEETKKQRKESKFQTSQEHLKASSKEILL